MKDIGTRPAVDMDISLEFYTWRRTRLMVHQYQAPSQNQENLRQVPQSSQIFLVVPSTQVDKHR